MPETKTNRLANETSPYLLQHAHNPVDWFPWGEEALEKSRAEDKPILLSIGYSACHWCHVMERESFENPATAKLMNEWFVCVKVDREERPDIDSIYMAATVAMNHGQGGWPMTVFLTPEQAPFFAGTYFPPQDAHGRPGFPKLLSSLNDAWQNDRPSVLNQSKSLVRHLSDDAKQDTTQAVSLRQIDQAVGQLHKSFDPIHGGFSPAPKFPAAASISLLLRTNHRRPHLRTLHMANHTLEKMALGGIYDHVGGGFARYSVDEEWLVPHFEKMLYDNALLTRAYGQAWQQTKNPLFLKVVRETLDFVLRELTGDQGGFYSALDADSEGEEGKFYVWSEEEIRRVLPASLTELFCCAYDVSEAGNFEGHNILRATQTHEDLVSQFGMTQPEIRKNLRAALDILLEQRTQRTRPGTDDKVITEWNGMMIGAMALGAQITGDTRYLDAAKKSADFIEAQLTRSGRLLRTWRKGKGQLQGYLEDYAFLSEGLLDLYEAGGGAAYLMRARDLAATMLHAFGDPEGGALYATAHDHEALIVRKKEGYDGATPSANGVAACVLARLAQHFHDDAFRNSAISIIESFGETISKMPRAFCKTLHAVDTLLHHPIEIALCGHAQAPHAKEMRETVFATYLPNRVIAHEEQGHDHPLLEGRAGQEVPMVYVCRDFTCQQPAQNTEALEAELGSHIATMAPRSSMASAIAGKAIAQKTGQVSHDSNFPKRVLGTTNLHVSTLGFGSYRVDEGNQGHQQALEHAILGGLNLIDTSSNYTIGSSERLIGRTLKKLVSNEELDRETMVIVSKGGYLQGDALKRMRARKNEGSAPKELVEYSDTCWHCMQPTFLAEELGASLGRLGLETIDVYLLHNPEYYLLHAQRVGGATRPKILATFYDRLKAAFSHLETEIQAGRIQFYGISSNTLADPHEQLPSLDLEKILEIAKLAGGENHGFRVVQFPLNLLESESAILPQKNGQPLLETAAAASLGVLVNRPLNAILGGGLVRLAQPDERGNEVELAPNMLALDALEQSLRERLALEIPIRGETVSVPFFFNWADEFKDMVTRFRNVVEWEDLLYGLVNPRLNQSVAFLQQHLKGDHASYWQEAFPRYRDALEKVCQDLRSVALHRSTLESDLIRQALDESQNQLSHIAIGTAVSTPGITSVLNGMRQIRYVDDAMAAAQYVPTRPPKETFQALTNVAKELTKRNLNENN